MRQWILFSIIFIVYSGLLCVDQSINSIKRIAVDRGLNISLPCKIQDFNNTNVLWKKEGKNEAAIAHLKVLKDGSLFLYGVSNNDAGIYTCLIDSNEASNKSQFSIRLKVRTTPPKLVNVTVHASTILALILWDVNGTGGYPINSFTAKYRQIDTDEEWKFISPNHISPNSRQVELYKLTPNTTYSFRIWATNFLGNGEVSEVNATTLKAVTEQELAQYLLPKDGTLNINVIISAVIIVMTTLTILSVLVCYLLYVETKSSTGNCVELEQESIELVPNIILNPVFDASIAEKVRQVDNSPKMNSNHRQIRP